MIKCSASLAFYHFSPTGLINSIKHDHSLKILYVYTLQQNYKHLNKIVTNFYKRDSEKIL